MPECDGISNQIQVLEEERESIQSELQSAPASMKGILLRELRLINAELGRLRQQLLMCQQQTPPVAKPDLLAQTVRLHVNHEKKQLGVAALIKNIGLGAAHGPFRIDLAATIYRGGTTTSFVQVFEVPVGVTIYGQIVNAPLEAQRAAGQTVNDQAAALVQAASLASVIGVPGWPPVLSQEYITEDMVVPLHYRDENPSAIYEFEFIVDSEQQVSEVNEGNNHFFSRWWTTQPQSVQRTRPFEVEVKEGKTERVQTYKEGTKAAVVP